MKADPAFADLRAALDDGRLRRLAIANPEHAPYGRAARQALEHEGLWNALSGTTGSRRERLAGRAVRGFRLAQAGIFALSLALAPDFAGKGDYVLIPESRHEPLHQRAVLLRRSGETARAFLSVPPAACRAGSLPAVRLHSAGRVTVMDWEALRLSLLLAVATGLVLIPAGVMVARGLAYADFRGKSIVEAAIAIPLVLPPTVLGITCSRRWAARRRWVPSTSA